MKSLSIIVPCYNEEKTLRRCIERVLSLQKKIDRLQIVIVDDCSIDQSLEVAHALKNQYPSIIEVLKHETNMGKGAALRTGFGAANCDVVAIQDADLEYNPQDLIRLIKPIYANKADVVFGSRFLSHGAHRVLYYYHSLGNKFLTLVSNAFTDLNLTDMETCYKVFKREIIQDITIEESRFGFEPEITAKVAHKRCRIYEMGISYEGRTYSEGKKIGWRDGFRALYCIFKYNAHKAPMPLQLLIYLNIGAIAAAVNLLLFLLLYNNDVDLYISTPMAFVLAALVNYYLTTAILFKRNVKWNSINELLLYFVMVISIAVFDLLLTKAFLQVGFLPSYSKVFATLFAFLLNFTGRKYLIFPESSSGDWNKQNIE